MIRQAIGRMKTVSKMVTRGPFDGFDQLRADHMKAELLLVQVRLSRDAKSRKTILDKVSELLGLHMAIEEMILYPVLGSLPSLGKFADHMHSDHQMVKDAVKDMQRMEPMSKAYNGLLMKLIIAAEKHIYEEENRAFAEVQSQLGRDELDRLSQAILKAHSEGLEAGRKAA